MKRFVLLFTTLCLLLTMAVPVFAEETQPETTAATEAAGTSGSWGGNMSWSLEGNTLTISGSGEMAAFEDGTPWAGREDDIHTVILSGGVTTVAAGAFAECEKLTAVDFGGSLKEVGESAFQSCEGLTTISLPASFRKFGESSFEGCSNLTEVYCSGGMPSFKSNCLWNGNTVTVYCPTNNPWPSQYVEELENNFHGRLQVLTADGTNPYNFNSQTEAPTQATTAPTTEPTTAPTTEPTTAPTTEPTTAPTTEPTTVPTTEVTETTEATETLPAPTEQQESKSDSSPIMGILIGVLIISGTLSLLLIGLLIFRSRRDRDFED